MFLSASLSRYGLSGGCWFELQTKSSDFSGPNTFNQKVITYIVLLVSGFQTGLFQSQSGTTTLCYWQVKSKAENNIVEDQQTKIDYNCSML